MLTPETRYAQAGDAEIAYQTVGSGPVDLVWAYGMMTHLEVKWEQPSVARMLRRLSGFSRLVLFDRRGCGLSDRGDRHLAPTLEERVQDVVAVLDAIGSERAALFGVSEGCALAAVFAATHPDRTDRIVLYGGISRLLRDPQHPWGVVDADQYEAAFGPVFQHWGTVEGAAAHVRLIAPSAVDDADYVAWFARQQRLSLSRDAVERFMRTVTEYDLDEILPAVRTPTLVLHRAGDTIVPSSSAERVASRIAGSRLVELPGADHLPYVGDADAVVDAVRDFLDVPAPRPPADSRLVTLVAVDAGDREGLALAGRHAERFGGVGVSSPAGDLLCFDSATRAVRCALGVVRSARDRGMALRAAVHTGECVVADGTVAGPAAEIVATVLGAAPPGRVATTTTVRDVLPGSGITFTDDHPRPVAGMAAEVCVLTVADPDATGDAARSGDAASAPVPGTPERVFRLDGEFWTLAFEGTVVRVADSKGMRDLAQLLAAPGRERHVLDLWAGAPARASATAEVGPGRAGARRQEVVDAEARARYRRRLSELDADDAGSGAGGDATGRDEREWLVHELARAYGVGGGGRPFDDEAERARKAVYRRVASALRRVEQAHPDLGRHLRASVHTGVFCSYAPERDHAWVTTGRPVSR